MLVCKFGGSSLADARCFQRVSDIIRSSSRRRCIIVSAPGRSPDCGGKITDLLIEASRTGVPGPALDCVKERFSRIARDLGLRSYEKELASLDEAVHSGRDKAASRGEWLCALMLSEYIGMPFVDAADVFRFDGAIPDIPLTYASLRSRVRSCAVIPGFYGSDRAGRIVTFPRGGSDICGALAAAALNAEAYENWTDVNGVLTSDPALVPESRTIPHMDYASARTVAMAGADVIHWGCIAPLEKPGIPIHIKNTFDPAHPGTVISGAAPSPVPCIACRVYPENDARITVCPASASDFQALFPLLPAEASIVHSGNTITIICPAENLQNVMRMADRILGRSRKQ